MDCKSSFHSVAPAPNRSVQVVVRKPHGEDHNPYQGDDPEGGISRLAPLQTCLCYHLHDRHDWHPNGQEDRSTNARHKPSWAMVDGDGR